MIHQIIDRHKRYGWVKTTSEWDAIRNEQRAGYHSLLDTGDVDGLTDLFANMLRSEIAHGIVSLPSDPDTLPVSLAWKMGLWARGVNDLDMGRLNAPKVGNPIVVGFDHPNGGTVGITLDVHRFDNYADTIVDALPTGTVVEVGCGYGGVALQVLRASTSVQMVLCDLPDTLYLAWYFLGGSTRRTVAWWDDDPTADVVLLPAHERDQWTGPVDMVFSAHSFSGMDRETSADYMAWVERSGARYFYHDDVQTNVPEAWMNERFPEVLASEIVPKGFTELWRERGLWTGIDDRFCEFFYERDLA